MRSVLDLTQRFTKERPNDELVGPRFIGTTIIARARNSYASLILQDPSYTHLLFIDSDMGFSPEAVVRMMDLEKDFCGCIYPMRVPNEAQFYAAARKLESPELARSAGQTFVGAHHITKSKLNGNESISVHRGFVLSTGVGMGLTLIRRRVFEAIAEKSPELICPSRDDYLLRGIEERVLQCFESLSEDDGMFIGEDLSFCRRWIACGGEIWACIDETITHMGPVVAKGTYVDRLRAFGLS